MKDVTRVECGISFGANLGDRVACFRKALNRLLDFPGLLPVRCSSVYETEPVDVSPAYQSLSFYNAMVLVTIPNDTLFQLAHFLHGLESEFGRIRTGDRNAPRPLDLDLIYAGQLQIDTPDLKIPHRRWAERRFVVEPLAEIRGGLHLPGQTEAVEQILKKLPPTPKAVKLTVPGWPLPGWSITP